MAAKTRRAAASRRKAAATRRATAKPAARAGARTLARRRPGTKPRRDLWASLKPGPANFAPLTPLSFLPRTAEIHPDRIAVVHGTRRITYADCSARARRLASALARRRIVRVVTGAPLSPNVPAMLEALFGVPPLGAL